MLQYYVRILDTDEKKGYKVQWINGISSWTETVHPHMIESFNHWKRNNPDKKERSGLTPKQLQNEKAFIEQETEICGLFSKIAIDTIETPMVTGYAVWCNLCSKWYADNCFSKPNSLNVYEDLKCDHSILNILPEFITSDTSLKEIHTFLKKKLKKIPADEISEERTLITDLLFVTEEKQWLQDYFINAVGQQQESNYLHVMDSLIISQIEQLEPESKKWDRFVSKVHAKTQGKNLILIPYNDKNVHWRGFLIVIDDKKRNAYIHSYDSFDQDEIPHKLNEQVKQFLKQACDIISFDESSIVPISYYQTDGSSCGVFLSGWIQSFSDKKVLNSWIKNKPVVYDFPKTDARLIVLKNFLNL